MANWTEYELGELLIYEQPTQYIVQTVNYSDAYPTPVLTAGKSFILGYTNEKEGVFCQLPVIIFDDFTTDTKYVNFPFKVKSSAMKILHINEKCVLPKYIFYRMQIIQFDHSTHKRYWIQQYSKIRVSVPPLDEQARIVSLIEKLFSELDNGVETLKKTKQQLAVYRQAVLKGAFAQAGAERIKLGSIIEKPRYGTSKKCLSEKSENDIPVYRIPNIDYRNSKLSHADLKYANFKEQELTGIDLRANDILIIRSNGSVSLVGRSAIVETDDTHATFAGYLIRLRLFEPSNLYAKFYNYFLASHEARVYIENVAKSTSGVNNINSNELRNMMVPVCDDDKKSGVIAMIESRLSVCDSIEQTIDTALQQAEAMRQSILKKAFEGNL